MANSNQQKTSLAIDNTAEKIKASKVVQLASVFLQEPFKVLLPKYQAMISSPEVRFQ